MTDKILGSMTDATIGVALNGLAARQREISNNLANIDTPGFKASQVRFEDQLQNAISAKQGTLSPRLVSSNARHITLGDDDVDHVRPEVIQMTNTSGRLDGNNVDIDKEMVQLADTTISYNALVQLITARISLARYIVNEGKR
ncbi:MAG: flagellar basal body rod protein FlgB [Chloroflexi bacterium]|nr:flagellar basal body rod protein FlgB [Chloroflexota bacterium]